VVFGGVRDADDRGLKLDEALSARLEETNLFCRVTPVQKNRIILALKDRGHVVAYLGDGINDAPSLHTSDVGISVDSAVDVAKDAADIILPKQDLGVLARRQINTPGENRTLRLQPRNPLGE
jgi:Mg2+-importing ATPase